MNSNKIPVVMSSDNKVFFTVATVIVSMLENANKDAFYDIYVLCTDTVTDENKNKLSELKKQYENFSLSFMDMKDTFKNIPKTHKYVNYVSAFKFLIPSLFPQFDKIIYLDTDVIVRADLTDLYNTDIGDNYVAGCLCLVNHITCRDDISKETGMESMDYYINAGVILMNLKLIRENKIDKQCIDLIGSFKGSIDQHIMNKVCYGKIFFLPLKYNVSNSSLKIFESGAAKFFYSLQEIEQAYKNPAVFHWTGGNKPWQYYNLFLSHEWFRYFIKTPFKYMKLDRKCVKRAGLFSVVKRFLSVTLKKIWYSLIYK
ncbi:glycosyltransferase family 8 protein [Candidatus Ruminimicrobiellum ovillum]|uniref:glycosyltransferase family 8 protein n=1 Tax=Candidatus Ruminimicrobiellum ovillum TaxID=1947927 RepID=UPI003559F8A0